jgi:hypothetical protein
MVKIQAIYIIDLLTIARISFFFLLLPTPMTLKRTTQYQFFSQESFDRELSSFLLL